jgi:hypothetical protein
MTVFFTVELRISLMKILEKLIADLLTSPLAYLPSHCAYQHVLFPFPSFQHLS